MESNFASSMKTDYTSFRISKINKEKMDSFREFIETQIIAKITTPLENSSDFLEFILRFVMYKGYLSSLKDVILDNPIYYEREKTIPLSLRNKTRLILEQYLKELKVIEIDFVDKQDKSQIKLNSTNQIFESLTLTFDDHISMLFSLFKHRVQLLSEKTFQEYFVELYPQ